jgi:hypothetical protein
MLGLGSLFPDMLGMPSFDDVGGMLASPEQIALWEMMKQRPEIQDIFSRDWSADVESNAGENELMGGAYSDVLGRFATLESGGGRFRSNPMSSARGLLHFMPDTWKGVLRNYPDLGFTPEDIDNDKKQLAAGERLIEREIAPALRRTLGREPTGAELYTAWALGTPDAQKLFGADPNTPAASLFRPKVASSNPSIFYRDKEATMPRTVAEVAAEYARRWSGAKPTKEPTMQQPEYDVDEGLANVARMGQRVAQMQPAGVSALPDRQPGQGLSALSPYLQIASQLMPQREGRPWADALINAGAAMMQSRSPDFLGGLGAGLQAGNQTLTQGQNLARQDTLDRFKLGMQLAQYDQKDGGEYAMSDGVLYNKKTGQTQQVGGDKPMSDVGKLQSDLRAGRITPEEYEAALAKVRGEGESQVERVIREMGIDRNGPQAQELRRKYAERVGGGATVNIDNKAETEFARKVAGAQAEAYTNVQKGAAEAISSNARLDRMSQLLEGVQTGKYSTSLMELQKGLSTILGKNAPTIFGKPAEVAQAEAASALANEIALTLRNPAGGAGMPGAMSDADRQFLQSMVPGLETTPEGRKLMVETAKSLNKRAVEVARLMEEYRKSNNNSLNGWELYLADWSEKNPLFAGVQAPEIPAAVPPRAAPNPTGAAGPPAEPPPPPAPTETLRVETPTPDGTGTRVQTVPVGRGDGSIPTFTDPNDPALLALPKGSVFFAPDGKGGTRLMERK